MKNCSLKIEDELYERIKQLAKQERRSVSKQIIHGIEKILNGCGSCRDTAGE